MEGLYYLFLIGCSTWSFSRFVIIVFRARNESTCSATVFFFQTWISTPAATNNYLFFSPPFWVPLNFLMKLGQRVAEADANIEAQGRYLAVLMCKNVTWKHSPTNRNECNDAIHWIIMELGGWWILIHTHIGLSKRGFPHSIHWFIINFLIRIAFLGYLTIGLSAKRPIYGFSGLAQELFADFQEPFSTNYV